MTAVGNLESLTQKALRLKAYQACRNLIGRFSFYNACVCRKELCELFSKGSTSSVESPWGVYEGYDGVWRRYVEEHGDRTDPVLREKFRGNTVIHGVDTEIIEVAEDGLSARGYWLSPGADFSVNARGEGASAFCWIRVYADFVCEDGVWRIKSYGFGPVHRMGMGENWCLAGQVDFAKMYPTAAPDRAREPECWQFGSPYTGEDIPVPRPASIYGKEAEA